MSEQGHRSQLPRREQIIVELLRLAGNPDLLETREGIRGDTGTVPTRAHEPRCRLRVEGLRCTCWLRSHDELTRTLRLMHGEQRRLWWQVTERYVMADRRPRTVLVHRGHIKVAENMLQIGLVNRTDLNRHGDGTTRVLVETWRAGLDPVAVLRGVGWIADHFIGSPQLPVDMLGQAAA